MTLDCRCLVLAAGRGTRLLPLTKYVPKPLFPVLNQPAVDTLIARVKDEGIKEPVINCHHLADQLISWAAARGIPYLWEKILLDTGGAIKNAFDKLGWDKPLLVYNADIVSNVSVRALFEKFQAAIDLDALFCLHDHPTFNKVVTSGQRIESFKGSGSRCLAYTGIAIFTPDLFKNAPDSPFPLIPYIQSLIERGAKIGFCRGEMVTLDNSRWMWHDIGTPTGYLHANLDLLATKGKEYLLDHCHIQGNVQIGNGVIAGKGANISGSGRISKSVIWPETRLFLETDTCNCILTPFGTVEARTPANDKKKGRTSCS
ncbi:MAG: NTP transferase domain-containing protein [Thermodesulfobacteria bacterium]|nr:NTP transferase domain-containing protein [Thermodesulfobacteriota bacterium]